MATGDTVWCGERKGRAAIRREPRLSFPATECILVVTEAAVVDNLEVYGMDNLREVADMLSGASAPRPTVVNTREEFAEAPLNPAARAAIAIGRMPRTGCRLPSSDSSPIIMYSSSTSLSIPTAATGSTPYRPTAPNGSRAGHPAA